MSGQYDPREELADYGVPAGAVSELIEQEVRDHRRLIEQAFAALAGPQQGAPPQAPLPYNAYDSVPAKPTSQDLAQLWHDYQRTGSRDAGIRYAKARLHGVITDEFLNQ